MPLSVVTAPTVEPLTVAEVKHQIKQGDAVDDGYIGSILIPAVRDRCELVTGRQLIRATLDYLLDAWPGECVYLPKSPLVASSPVLFVKYYDTGGTLITLTENTDYLVQAPQGPRAAFGRITLPFSAVWPTALDRAGAIQIRFVAGYGAGPDSVPALLRQAMLVDAAHLYSHREDFAKEPAGFVGRTYWSYRAHPIQRVAA